MQNLISPAFYYSSFISGMESKIKITTSLHSKKPCTTARLFPFTRTTALYENEA